MSYSFANVEGRAALHHAVSAGGLNRSGVIVASLCAPSALTRTVLPASRLAVPVSVLFPRREQRRFQLRYHWDRLLSLIGR